MEEKYVDVDRVTDRFNSLDAIALVLTIIGALNWGLIGLFNINLVTTLFGDTTILSRIIYAIIGLAGLYLIYTGYKMFSGIRWL